jgi:hypothetical protein
MSGRINREFNIINNQLVSSILKYPVAKKTHSELKIHYNAPARFDVRRKLDLDGRGETTNALNGLTRTSKD